MNVSQIDWRLWRTFLAVIDKQSLSGAARFLSMTQPTVGRHIDALELALNAPLFTRSKAGLTPTDLAVLLLPGARRMAHTAASLTRQAANAASQLPSVVRITASEIVGTELLPPIIYDFRNTIPHLQFEVKITNELLNLPERSADIAIRMTRPTQEKLVAKKIRDAHLGLYASLDYVERRGVPTHVDSLLEHDLIGYDQDYHRLAGLKIGGRTLMPKDFSLRCDSDVAQLAATRSGLGIGLCHMKIAERGNLIPVLQTEISSALPIWLVMHEDLRSDKTIRTVFDYLAKTI